MKIIFKNIHIVFRRFGKMYVLAVAGLAVAYAVFYMLVVQSFYDLRFDRNFEKANSIYLYSKVTPRSIVGLGRSTNTIESRVCAERYPEIKNYCYISTIENQRFNIDDEAIVNEKWINGNISIASRGFIDMFHPKLLHGDLDQAFTHGYAMLTESYAKKMFGNKNPVGEIIRHDMEYDKIKDLQELTVAAVCADFPDNCSLENGIFAFRSEIAPYLTGFSTYFEINPSNVGRLLAKMNEEQYMTKAAEREDEIWQFKLTALTDIHLWFPALGGKGNFFTVLLLLTVGIALLVVSYINFLNFSIAMAPGRVRSINLRRILGESSFMLRLSIVLEAVFLSLIAFLLSVFIIQALNTGALRDFFIADLAMSKNPGLLLSAGVVSILAGFLAGIYPAYYSTSFNPAMAVSGSFSLSSRNQWIKNISTGAQFIAAIFLTVSMLFVKTQYDYMRSKDWGIQTENILHLNTSSNKKEVGAFISELKRNPGIIDATMSGHCFGDEADYGWPHSWGNDFEGTQVKVNVWPVRPEFFDFFGIKMVEGDKFKEGNDKKIILNRSFLDTYGFGDVVGKKFYGYEIIGIVEDFNYRPLYSNIEPFGFYTMSKGLEEHYSSLVFVKVAGTNVKQTAKYIGDTWKKFSSEPSEVLLLTDTIQNLYAKERNTASLISVCGSIAIIVAVIGLYGLVLFEAKSKRKSIAIRKVHGASIRNVMLMLNQNLFIKFGVSCLIALPLAYYAANRWLENFAYKTPVYWWVFALGGLIVLAVSLLTVSWETYKAASANPMEAVKGE